MRERGDFSSKTLVQNVFHFQKGLVRPWSGRQVWALESVLEIPLFKWSTKNPWFAVCPGRLAVLVDDGLAHLYLLCKISPCLSWERINPVNGGFFFGFWYPYAGAFPRSAYPPPPNHTPSSSQSNSNKRQPPPQPTWVTMRLKLKLNKN